MSHMSLEFLLEFADDFRRPLALTEHSLPVPAATATASDQAAVISEIEAHLVIEHGFTPFPTVPR